MHVVRGVNRWIAVAAVAAMGVLVACDPVPTQVAASWNVDDLAVGTTLSASQPGPVRDATGRHDLTVGPGSTAAVKVVAGAPGHGTALDFPASGYVDLHAGDPAGLSPGDRPFEVQVLLATSAAELDAHGNNVVQQGLFNQDQWKLQVDGGKASCRFADGDVKTGAHAAFVKSPTRIDDGAWWSVTCRKTASTVTLVLQRLGSAEVETMTVPSDVGSIESTSPVQVGSKATPSNPDQFHGLLDDVTVRIG